MRLCSPSTPPASLRFYLPFSRRAIVVFALIGSFGPQALAASFTVTSSSLQIDHATTFTPVSSQITCAGGNRSPQLSWRNAPAGTRSFAITVFDPDAPGRGVWHWAVAEIPATVSQLPENASASGHLQRLGAMEARNDFGTEGYNGLCPPRGQTHRYIITVYALGTTGLHLAPGRPALMFDHELGLATLGSASLIVRYGR
ncbi:YbhB/YbcL family Raf kinase inhibitor-like protein [Paraburkholderia hayleyella]|uniref:YbhB/YbcL family Raf kinase inhibitor-like protein n=1 Tax=Paraburkholderia hayleyella TaxID=2152889 RepID=UPI0012926B44|nr:YbhB/YbcL family Raf kinase inhibitor-like protein [Paraburkholderia hayleyella]